MADETAPHDDPKPAEPEVAIVTETPPTTPPRPAISGGLILGFVLLAVLGAGIAMMMRNTAPERPTDEAALRRIKSEYNTLMSEYNKERASMGLRPLESDAEPVEAIAERLKKDADSLVAIASSYQNLLTEKESELTARKAEILRGEKLRGDLVAESRRLQGEVQRALASGADSTDLSRALVDSNARGDALLAELRSAQERLQAMSSSVAAEDFADLKRRLEETTRAKEFYETRVKELEAAGSAIKLFAKSEEEMLPAAAGLIRRLRQFQDEPQPEGSPAYAQFGNELGANVLRTVSFATGSSSLSPDDEAAIRELTADADNGDLLVAIGYASNTGDVDQNEKLSSDRATAVARLIETVKRPDQFTQAMYLGQTDRFSPTVPERNQIVEIWRVKAKQ